MIMPTDVMQDYLNVRYHHVEVTIDGVHATTQVEQEFYNPFPYAVSGQYLFPVPPDMILSDFQVTLEGAAQAAVRQDRAATNAILYQMVADRRDPSLLQYIDWETLALDIDLAPGGSRVMTIQYEEVLALLNNALHYRYIMSTERYSAAPLGISVDHGADAERWDQRRVFAGVSCRDRLFDPRTGDCQLVAAVHEPDARLRPILHVGRKRVWRHAAHGWTRGRLALHVPVRAGYADFDRDDASEGYCLRDRPVGKHGRRKDPAGPRGTDPNPGAAERERPVFDRRFRRHDRCIQRTSDAGHQRLDTRGVQFCGRADGTECDGHRRGPPDRTAVNRTERSPLQRHQADRLPDGRPADGGTRRRRVDRGSGGAA
ncbi:MAG: hypothetical protein IPK52_16145 [Chloroflexi bacterium]|nr:hypothetical protein [Chloroflexota bacterium]